MANRNSADRKWRTYADEAPIQLSDDAPLYKKIHLEYERHTFKCNRCSMFALKKKYSAKMMCRNGACIAARYYNAKEKWMHENPVKFAMTVVGAVLRARDKAAHDERDNELERSPISNDSLASNGEQVRPRSADRNFNKKWDREYESGIYPKRSKEC